MKKTVKKRSPKRDTDAIGSKLRPGRSIMDNMRRKRGRMNEAMEAARQARGAKKKR